MKRYNLILMAAHGLGWRFLGVNGDDQARTPCLDRLTRESAFFPRAVATRPGGAGDHAMLLSGRYAPGSGERLPALLRRAGYAVAFSDGEDDPLEALARCGAPFALFVFFPGDPVLTPAERAPFRDVWFRRPPNYGARGETCRRPAAPRLTRAQDAVMNDTLRQYYAGVARLDTRVGGLMSRLRALALERETLVAFTSDGGPLFGAHGLSGHGAWFDEAVRVPCLLRQPLRLRPGPRNVPMGTPDLMPTVLSLLALPTPMDCNGSSLSPYIDSLCDIAAGSLIEGSPTGHGRMAPWVGYRTERYALAYRTRGWEPHLYDVGTDPYQRNDLAGDPAHAELLVTLREALRRELLRIADPLSDGLEHAIREKEEV